MYLSTLRNCIEAVGGDLELIVRFPKQEPVHLNGLEKFSKLKSEHNRLHRIWRDVSVNTLSWFGCSY